MARQTEDQQITTREARKRLVARREPYWRGLDAGAAIGYRKAALGGTWIARVRVDGQYREHAIGRADDALRPDGTTVLDYRQAAERAKAWGSGQHAKAAGLDPERDPRAPYTVADAMRDYMADFAARGGKGVKQTQQATDAHIIPALGPLRLDRLTRERIKAWHRALADAPARRRSKAGGAQNHDGSADADAPRRRQSTANRVLTVLKAALNHAAAEGRASGAGDAWKGVKPFREADGAKVRYLQDEEITRLVNACPGDFRILVTAALLTGCRYGEIAAMKAADFDAKARTVTVGRSKSGKPRHVVLTDEGAEFFQQQAAGKARGARLFERDIQTSPATKIAPAETERAAWGKSHQFRMLREACAAAKIAPAVSFHILRHTYATRLASNGTPMPVIAAQLGHKDTRMTERHYAHLAPSYVADVVRAAFSPLGIVAASNVTPLARQAAG